MLAGCSTSAPPSYAPIQPLAVRGAIMPTDGDLAAADVAIAVMANDSLAGLHALGRIHAYEKAVAETEEEDALRIGLPGYAQYALASTLDDPERFREAMEHLLDSDDLDPGLEQIVEQYHDDHPLKLARARVRDAWVRHLGTVFNQFAAPIGKSAASGAFAVAGFVRSVFKVMLYELQREEMGLAERQALGHWKRFVETNPDSEDAEDVVERIERDQERWNRLQRDRAVQAGEKALERGQPRVALVMAERALMYENEDSGATQLRDEARDKVKRWQEARESSEQAIGWGDVAPPEARALALALLGGGGDPAAEAEALFFQDPQGPLADEARFVMATMRGENGNADAMWEYMTAISMVDPYESNMSRHAQAAVRSPSQHPYRAYRLTRNNDRVDQVKWIFFGPLGGGPQDRNLPRPLEWLVDMPTLVELFMSMPNRLVFFPWMQPWPFGKAPAAYARRYLERYPDGSRFNDVAAWLQDWEQRRGNHVGAFDVALVRTDLDDGDLTDLEEAAAEQKFEASEREPRTDARLVLLKGIAREHPQTEWGQKAGHEARKLALHFTSQRIRLSRGFLEEHRFVAGPDGIGLEPIYLDGNERNGELHPDGISLVGGRTLEFSFLAESGKEKDEPERRYRTISKERMSRLVSLLDETSLRLAQLESDYEYVSDADRDTFFEAARLGVADETAVRSSARSEYAFEGMREQYGLVRSRDSILPFELVVQGSLYDFGFGVFPLIRMPKPTPDAFLYR